MINGQSQSENHYPSECLRGIPPDISLEEAKEINRKIFRFSENNERQQELGNYKEMSITWNDCDEAVQVISEQRSERRGGFQFPLGFVIVKRSTLDVLKRDEEIQLEYERCEIQGNKYHGNILICQEASKNTRRKASTELASKAHLVLRDHDTGKINITSQQIKDL